jgi:hypothetical protein
VLWFEGILIVLEVYIFMHPKASELIFVHQKYDLLVLDTPYSIPQRKRKRCSEAI